MGSLRVGHDWAASLSLFTFMHWRRKWQPTPVFLPGESQGRGSLLGCHLRGRRVGRDWSDLAAAAAAELYKSYIPSWSRGRGLDFRGAAGGGGNSLECERRKRMINKVCLALQMSLKWEKKPKQKPVISGSSSLPERSTLSNGNLFFKCRIPSQMG